MITEKIIAPPEKDEWEALAKVPVTTIRNGGIIETRLADESVAQQYRKRGYNTFTLGHADGFEGEQIEAVRTLYGKR